MGTYVALLRGINVGGKNKLPMKDLATLCAELDCRDVETYIQSGNLVFRASAPLARRLPTTLAAGIAERFGLTVPVVLRSVDELRQVVRANPFAKSSADPKLLHVAFLADRPGRRELARLDPNRSPPDELAVSGREIYLCCPNGMARSKLTNDYFDRTLSTTSTMRNWRTVQKLLDMAGEG